MMFDYESYARRHNVNQDTLESILRELREEIHGDEMMVELHAIRVIKNISEQGE
jgi:hypothetical protein